jgi:hypothetical protein
MHDFVSHAWHPIGGPGASFAVTPDTVYGLTPDRGAVFRYLGTAMQWEQIGAPGARSRSPETPSTRRSPPTRDRHTSHGPQRMQVA